MTCIAATNAMITVQSVMQNAPLKESTEKITNSLNSGENSVAGTIKTQTETFDPHLRSIATRMCQWAAPNYTRAGEAFDRIAWIAAQVAVSASTIALNTFLQNQNYKIARAYSDIANDKWSRFMNFYAPLEMRMIAECLYTAEPSTDYGGAQWRATVDANFSYDSGKNNFARYAKSYALCIDPTLDLTRAQSILRADSTNFNFRDAEHFREYLSDKRWNRRSDILNIGRNNHATAFSYARAASEALGGLAGAVAQIGNGLSGLLGYMYNRNDTVYPSTFAMAVPYGNNGALMAGSNGTQPVF